MGKISQYTRALKAKLSDLFVVASSDNGSLSTKAVTTEQIGNAVITEQTFSGLDGKTPASAISDNATAIGDLSQLSTSVTSSLVGAVNEAVGTKNLYQKSIYQNDVGQTITLSETTANFRFIRLSVYITDTSYSNAGMLLVANCKNAIQVQHFPLCINAVLGSVRIDLSGTSLKLYSTSFGSTMFISRVDGIY